MQYIPVVLLRQQLLLDSHAHGVTQLLCIETSTWNRQSDGEREDLAEIDTSGNKERAERKSFAV